MLSTVLQGVYQSHQATPSACAVNNLHLLLAQIGKPGGGLLQMNGQPTAQNNREAGCNGEFPAFRNHQNSAHMEELAAVWQVESHQIASWHVPTHIMTMLNYIEQGSIKMLWVSGTNPAVSLPELGSVRDLLSKPDLFLVVQDCFLTETAELASVVLPAAIWGEKRGCFTNADRTVHFSEKAIEPPGEARADFDIFCDFARRMKFTNKHGEPLVPFRTPEEAFKNWKECSRGRVCDYTGLSYERLKREGGIQWPCNEKHPQGCRRLYSDNHFLTDLHECESWGHDLDTGCPLTREQYANLNPRGRAIFKVAHYRPPPEAPNPDFPFSLITGRSVYHFHTRTKTGRMPVLQRAAPDAWVELNETDASKLGIADGDLVRVQNAAGGSIDVPAKIVTIAPGQVFVPMHFGSWDRKDLVQQGVVSSGRALTTDGKGATNSTAANELTNKLWDPVSKQPLLKWGAVKLTRVASAEEASMQVKLHSGAASSSRSESKRHPQSEAVQKQQEAFAAAGGVAAFVPDTRDQQQYLPFELNRAAVHSELLERTLARLHAKYTAKRQLELCAELGVLTGIAHLMTEELKEQAKRFPLLTSKDMESAASKQSGTAVRPTGSEGGSRPNVGGGAGGATLSASASAYAASTADLQALHDALFLSDDAAAQLGSSAMSLLRDLQGLHTFAAGLEAHLALLYVAGAAVHDSPLAEAIQRCSAHCRRCSDWPIGQAKPKAPQALIVPA